MDIVESILQKSNYKSIEVEKDIEVEFDIGNLLASDSNVINEDEFRESSQDCLQKIARDNAQLLINQLWKLPTDMVDGVYIAKLPTGATLLPREKPIPTAKKPTKWEAYAKQKGIQKKKKTQLVWDEKLKEYRPRWGYKKANDDSKEWCLEVPDHVDPNEDQFEKKQKAKKEAIAKNELLHMRNMARNMKGKLPGVTMMPVKNPGKQELSIQQTVAKSSTASLGKFQESLPKEKSAKNMGKKRKFESNFGDIEMEKKKAKAVYEKIKANEPLVDQNRAANLLKAEEETTRSRKSEKTKGKDRRSKKGHPNVRKNSSKSGPPGTPKSGQHGKPKSGHSGKPKSGPQGKPKSGQHGKPKSGKGHPGKQNFKKGKP